MIGQTGLLNPSAAPHLQTFQVFLIYWVQIFSKNLCARSWQEASSVLKTRSFLSDLWTSVVWPFVLGKIGLMLIFICKQIPSLIMLKTVGAIVQHLVAWIFRHLGCLFLYSCTLVGFSLCLHASKLVYRIKCVAKMFYGYLYGLVILIVTYI
jgi:hypothetical protein